MVIEKVRNVPKIGKVGAVFVFLINLILPGFGTIIAACMTDEERVSKTQLIVGFL